MYYVYRKLLIFISVLVLTYIFGGMSLATLIDMRDVMHSWYKENQEKGSLKSFPQGTVNGNLYEKAHAMAELQLAHPALQALDLTYEVISQQCGGENFLARDVTNVFAKSSAGEQFRLLLDAREMVSTVKDAGFNESCLAVYTCYNKDALEKKGVDIQHIKLSDDIYRSCTSTVDDIFMVMYQRASSLETMKNINYGDDFLVNAKPEDGPYDLLLDVQAIGDVLFGHNDGPSEVHFYDMEPVGSYVTNNPDELTTFTVNKPEEKERRDRWPSTNGVTPSVPQEAENTYPSKSPLQASAQALPSSPGGGGVGGSSLMYPNENGPSAQAAGEQSSPSIANSICEVPLNDEPETEDVLQLAQQENEQTKTYNTKIDLDTEVAVLLASKMPPEKEEELGVTPRGGPTPPSGDTSDSPASPEAEETTKAIFDQLLDLDGASLEDMKNRIQQCVDQFTEGDTGARSKILLKSITQPAEFTKCVFGHLCKEIGDPTGRGMFRIKVCRELRKGSGIVSNQSVKSAEEVVDEMLNVCTTLKESGALLEHNKTKDHIEDKLMRIKFGNKFAFGISVIFKGPRDAVDPATAKQREIEKRAYLEEATLNFTDDLTFVDERNRYLVVQGAGSAGSRSGLVGQTVFTQKNQLQLEQNLSVIDALYKKGVVDNKNRVGQELQLQTTAGTIEVFQRFILENIEMRKTANQYTDSINQRWATTLRLYQASPN